jgi:ferredoxin
MPKLIQYRNKCIGCGICFDMMPAFWRMSHRDGKATLVNAVNKKGISVLEIDKATEQNMKAVTIACPVKIIRIS